MIQVIFTNGKFGEIRDTHLGRVLGQKTVAAFKPFDVWVEVRRRSMASYQGPERRNRTEHQ
jgi:hypothetical protein